MSGYLVTENEDITLTQTGFQYCFEITFLVSGVLSVNRNTIYDMCNHINNGDLQVKLVK